MAKHATPSNSLERALLILDLVGRRRGGLTNAEVSRQLGIATSSCSYIVSRLERDAYLKRDPQTGRYEIGLKVLSLANRTLHNLAIRKLAERALQKVAAETELSACLAFFERGRVVLVEKVGMRPAAVDVAPGSQLPLHTTALGKLLCAHLSDAQQMELIDARPLAARTTRTIVSKSALVDELRAVRARGHATSDEEHQLGLRAVAAPIVTSTDHIHVALSAAGTADQPIWSQPLGLVALVKAAARDVSRRALLVD